MQCDWNTPGADPFTGDMRAAVYSYDFPKHVAEELIYKIKRSNLDAVVTITKDGIHAAFGKASHLHDMHFGKSKKCIGAVVRDKWDVSRKELASVYCHDGYCLAIPKICGNISRIYYTPHTRPNIEYDYTKYHSVPEPSTILLLGVASIALLCLKKS